MASRQSVRPILEFLDSCSEHLDFIYKDVNTRPEFEYLVRTWATRRYSRYPIGYFAFHGDPGGMWVGESDQDFVRLEELAGLLKGKCEGRTIHFASCSVIDIPDSDISWFRRTTKARCVTGYTKYVDWFPSSAFDLLLFEALTFYTRPSAVERWLSKEYGFLMKRLGFKMFYGR